MAANRPLTPKEQRFIDAYLGPAAGNATEAMGMAGYRARTRLALGQQGSQLLRKPQVSQAITARQRQRTRAAILTAEERDSWLSQLAKRPDVPSSVQVAAIKELNKCSGRHSIKHVMDVTEKLSEIIAASRAPEEPPTT